MSKIKESLLDISVLTAVEDIVLQNSYAQIRREMFARGLLEDVHMMATAIHCWTKSSIRQRVGRISL